MEKSGIDFDELQKKLERPVNLSEKESEKITDIFKDLSTLLNTLEKEILEMDRDNAFRYMGILIKKFSESKSAFEGAAVGGKLSATEPKKQAQTQILKPEGYFNEIYNQLKPHEKGIANRALDCVKTALQLIESGEAPPEQVLCPECDLAAMRKCIGIEDPNVKDETDEELKARRAAGH